MRLRRKTDDDQGAQVLAFPGAEVVPAPHPALVLDEPAEVEPETDVSPWVPARLRTWVEQTKDRPLLPDPRRVVTTAGWYWEHAPQLVVRGTGRGLRTCVREVWLTLRGGGWLLARWGRWVSDADWRRTDKDIYLKIGESAYRIEKREHRLRLKVNAGASATGVLVLGGGGTWATLEWPHWSAVGWTVLVGTLNAIGHWTRPKDPDAPEPELEWVLLAPNVPLHKLRETILWVLKTQQGIEDLKADTLLWLEPRKQYRMRITTQHEMGDKDLRAVERRVGAAVKTIIMLDTDVSATRELVIPFGDPFESVPPCPWIPTGSVSVNDLHTLGVSVGETAFAMNLLSHMGVVGRTGSGKTKWALWTIIDILSACRDAVLWQAGVQTEPDITLWGGVIQNRGTTEDEAKRVLAEVKDEIGRRLRVLDDLAADDDPTNDTNEWHTGLGPALFVLLDEFGLLVKYPELLELAEYLIREGRKVMCFGIFASQKTGNTDWGSTLMQGQVNIKIVLACKEADTDKVLGVDARKSGWEPHKLVPGVGPVRHDAGKCFVEAPGLTEPDMYCFYSPLSNGEIKRRRAQRLADGLPTLTGTTTIDVLPIPDCLALMEAVFGAHPGAEYLSAADIATWCTAMEFVWDDAVRAELRGLGVRTHDKWVGSKNEGKKYFRADVEAAVRAVETGSLRP